MNGDICVIHGRLLSTLPRYNTFHPCSEAINLLQLSLQSSVVRGVADSSSSSMGLNFSDSCVQHATVSPSSSTIDALVVWLTLHGTAGSSISTGPAQHYTDSSSSSIAQVALPTPADTDSLGLFYLDKMLTVADSIAGCATVSRMDVSDNPLATMRSDGFTSQHQVPMPVSVTTRVHQHQLSLQFSVHISATAPVAPAGPTTGSAVTASPVRGHAAIATASTSSFQSAGRTGTGAAAAVVDTAGTAAVTKSVAACCSAHEVPRHAYLARWHFDMLGDVARNSSYDKAIRWVPSSVCSDNVLRTQHAVRFLHESVLSCCLMKCHWPSPRNSTAA
jgi:hypothetical protein